jgi:hypothetical protein
MRRRLPIVVAGIAVGIAVVGIAAALLVSPRTATAEGVVVAVQATSLADISGFTLRTAAGDLVEFGLEALENEVEFPPGHLAEHVASSAPVVVTYRDEGGRHLAIRIIDAPAAGPTAAPTASPT